MKHFKDTAGKVYAFEADGSQDDLITSDLSALSESEVAALLAPPQAVPAVVTMRQARLALLAAGKLQAVSAAIAGLSSPQREAAEIEWEYSATVERGSTLLALVGQGVGLDGPSLDALFTSAAQL